MADTELGGLAKAEKYYSDYGARARELKNSGRKVIGYLSALCPVEILTAAGVVPIRLKGNVSEAVTKADAYMETMICPFVRNVFDAALKGKYGIPGRHGPVPSVRQHRQDVRCVELQPGIPLLAFHQLPACGGRSFHRVYERDPANLHPEPREVHGKDHHRSGACRSGPGA